MRNFTSRKLKSKIVEVYNWETLTNEIAPSDIALPETSKDFITKAYHVVKINSKGKNQKRWESKDHRNLICNSVNSNESNLRLIKFTADSILNIDPKTKKIQNEKKLQEIQQLGAFYKADEVSN